MAFEKTDETIEVCLVVGSRCRYSIQCYLVYLLYGRNASETRPKFSFSWASGSVLCYI